MTYITTGGDVVEKAIFYHQLADWNVSAGCGANDKWTPRALTLEEYNNISGLEHISYDIIFSDYTANTITVSGTDADTELKQGRRFCVRGTASIDTDDEEYIYDTSTVAFGNTTISISTSTAAYIKNSIAANVGAGGKVYTGLLKFKSDMDVAVFASGTALRTEDAALQLAKYDENITYETSGGSVASHSGTTSAVGPGGYASGVNSHTMSLCVSTRISASAGDIWEVQEYNAEDYIAGGNKSWGAAKFDSEIAAASVPTTLLVDVTKIG